MIYLDACAIVAILTQEPNFESYDLALESELAITSPLAAWEASLVLSKKEKLNIPFVSAAQIVIDWLSYRNIALSYPASDPEVVLRCAIHAAQKYGVSRRALSNFDCFHYAFAKSVDIHMLTSDRSLRQTDLKTLP